MSIKYLYILIFFLSFIPNNSLPLKGKIQNLSSHKNKALNHEKVMEITNIKRNLEHDNNDGKFGEEEDDNQETY